MGALSICETMTSVDSSSVLCGSSSDFPTMSTSCDASDSEFDGVTMPIVLQSGALPPKEAKCRLILDDIFGQQCSMFFVYSPSSQFSASFSSFSVLVICSNSNQSFV
eukprot:GHVH01003277.1.p1 GENE.GHVH01003277.1~~GHVH01003277.1.p1  ORF type:complete len:107 (+),score=9.71 GHVH01003277.1:351-671(+)